MATSPTLRISPWKVLRLLLLSSLGMVLLSFLVQLYVHSGPEFRGLNSFVKLTNVDGENSLPSWYSAVLLTLCSASLYSIYRLEHRARRRYAGSWLGLALVFLALSIDETVQLHELVGDIIQEKFSLSGFFYFAWVIPGTLFVLAFIAIYLRFFLNLPAKTRYLALGAGVLYLGGALGVEIVTARYVADYGNETLTYAALSTLEEFLEMTGASLFLYTLLAYPGRLWLAAPGIREIPGAPPVAVSPRTLDQVKP